MKKFHTKLSSIITAVMILTSSSIVFTLADGHFTTGHYDYDQARTVTYSKRHCWQGFNRLKRTLKDEAKELCRSQGVTKLNVLVLENWEKYTCEKARDSHGRIVTVKGRFKAVCNY